MRPDYQEPADDVGRFCTTRWSAVLLSAQSEAPGSQAALAALCRIYWYPIYVLVRRRGHNADDAQDLTQGFFLHFLDYKPLRQVSPLKGKFRSFLASSLHNYLLNAADYARCLKRGGNVEFVPLDAENAEFRYQVESHDSLTPEKMFDARWAITLLGEVMTRLGQEYAAQGKQSTFEALSPFLRQLTAGPRSPTSKQLTRCRSLWDRSRRLFIACASAILFSCARRSDARLATPGRSMRKFMLFAKP